MRRPNIRRRLWRRGLVVLASAALLCVGLPAVFASADSDSPFFTGDTDGGVKTSRTDAGRFKHCADLGKGEDFQTATPEQVGLDPKVLDRLAGFHLAKAQRTLYVFRFGCLVKTGALNGFKERIDQPLIASAPNDMTYGWGWGGRHWFNMPNLGMMIVTTSMDHDFEYDPKVAGSEVAVQGEQMSGYHEFMRIAMRAVTDQKVPDRDPYRGREASLTAFNAGNWVNPTYTVQNRLTGGLLDPNKKGLVINAKNIARVMAHTGPFVIYN